MAASRLASLHSATPLSTLRVARVFAGTLTATLLLGACKHDDARSDDGTTDEVTRLAEDGTDSNSIETDTELLTSSLVAAGAGSSISLAAESDLSFDVSPDGVGDGAKALYFPRGCLDVVSDSAARKVTYTFSQCAGPSGIRRISGVITAVYAVGQGTLTLDLVGTQLRVNRAIVDWSAHAEITADGVTRAMHWKAQLTGTTPRGREFTRSNDKSISWRFGERCFSVGGVSEGTIDRRPLRTEITAFERCKGSCPEAGGRVAITNTKTNEKIELVFDGTNRATLIDPKGNERSFALACD
ncbi:hypothetical protein AKJ09_06220 [Labilithrix luteola]|uniref:Uncharacterized protein n=1 Tax=Labilithrix luteola TaxID=1391654 RepID=A0A0K1Q1N8_9BACT|nr:hypothetical protein [Labilithrix luteola]AKU99556.1 hypothetical protein AKJ09_06220 [Labilithrix luteola]